jgi:hypothetical protein
MVAAMQTTTREGDMAYALVLAFEGVGEADYWKVNENLGIARDSQDGYPDGLLMHCGGPTPTGWVVSELWDTKASQEAFMASRLGAALGQAGVPEPAQIIETSPVNLQQLG